MTRASWSLILAFTTVACAASSSTASSGKHGAVATEVAECSEAGLEILKAGGSASDAIIAASLCVGTISAYHSGIGGGGFGMYGLRAYHISNGVLKNS
jgi:gamma-glutamyltranspeptidase/glutathione hydrolase